MPIARTSIPARCRPRPITARWSPIRCGSCPGTSTSTSITSKEAGVEPPTNGAWSYQQFLDAAKKLTFKNSSGQQVYGFAQAKDEYAFLLIDGARPFSQDLSKWTFNTPSAESGFSKWQALPQAHVVPPDYLTLKPNDAEAHFVSKDVAILQRPSAFINILNSKPDQWQFGKNWDIANFPKGDG